ncbi:polysaccharide biosynthesis tyrosine autokinase [Caballeronia sp. LZ043]|uniref:polysaccharide biosynthesis tyrosine autokinase n=1 Tax=Caballeronia sp. LZ043 TaxID=3038569 RepID=UPI0028595F5D|nr:polysaccharide biosynthesis tyrosine autokinase [Caballeronia sp. LZ043]MDR5822762.1 polysaccharide biosynthesis tyrosine autokinase [Caballeronia sp. LZ043]
MEQRRIDVGPALMRAGDETWAAAAELSRLITDNLKVVILIIATAVAGAAIYAFLATPTYSADAVLQVDMPNPNGLGVTPQSQQQAQVLQGTLPTDAEMQIIQSRKVLGPVLDEYRLFVSVTPKKMPVLGTITEKFATPGTPLPAFFGLDSYAWGGEHVAIDTLDVPPKLEDKPMMFAALEHNRYRLQDAAGRVLVEGEVGKQATGNGVTMLVTSLDARPDTRFTVVRYNELNAIERFSRQLRVTELGKATGVVQISYETSDPTLAAEVTNAIAQTYITLHIAQRREEASRMRAFVDSELPRMRDELKNAEAELSQYKITAGSMQPSTEYASYLQASIDLDRQIATLGVQRAELLNHYVPDAREVRTVDKQIELLKAAKQKFEARFTNLPTSERRSADLTRSMKVAEEIYVAMLNKSNELAVTQAGTIGNVHIIDSALRPSVPIKPKRALMILMAAVLGTVVALIFLFVRRQVSSGVEDPDLVERRLHLPVFGTVLFSNEQARVNKGGSPVPLLASNVMPRSHDVQTMASELFARLKSTPREPVTEDAAAASDAREAAKRFVLAMQWPDDLSLEGLRNVRTALQFDISDAPNNILIMTGATPGTGKSFVSANLAVLQAETGKRVLLIDADLRRGHLAARFGQEKTSGMAELLAGKIEWDEAIRPVGVNNLSFIPAGEYPCNPSELLSTPRMLELLKLFSSTYDLVIVDTPPILAATDASIIAAHAGSTVLVIRPSVQTQRELQETLKRLDRTGARVVGAIFNAMPRRRSEKRSYDYVSSYAAATPGRAK